MVEWYFFQYVATARGHNSGGRIFGECDDNIARLQKAEIGGERLRVQGGASTQHDAEQKEKKCPDEPGTDDLRRDAYHL